MSIFDPTLGELRKHLVDRTRNLRGICKIPNCKRIAYENSAYCWHHRESHLFHEKKKAMEIKNKAEKNDYRADEKRRMNIEAFKRKNETQRSTVVWKYLSKKRR